LSVSVAFSFTCLCCDHLGRVWIACCGTDRLKLLFLHGPPAAGKLTVARSDRRKLFDNHVAIDLARHIFDFGAPAFWNLVADVRCLALEKAAEARLPLLVLTCCYSDPYDRPQVARYEAILASHGGELVAVFLQCPTAVLRARVSAQERVARGKVSDPTALDRLVEDSNMVALPRESCLTLDSASLSPAEAASAIIEHFKLRPLRGESPCP
jgi:adenylylsulfate kinase-like enzyme